MKLAEDRQLNHHQNEKGDAKSMCRQRFPADFLP